MGKIKKAKDIPGPRPTWRPQGETRETTRGDHGLRLRIQHPVRRPQGEPTTGDHGRPSPNPYPNPGPHTPPPPRPTHLTPQPTLPLTPSHGTYNPSSTSQGLLGTTANPTVQTKGRSPLRGWRGTRSDERKIDEHQIGRAQDANIPGRKMRTYRGYPSPPSRTPPHPTPGG